MEADRELAIIKRITRQHLPKTHRAFIFGSRATGTNRPHSDYDLGVNGPHSEHDIMRVYAEDLARNVPSLVLVAGLFNA